MVQVRGPAQPLARGTGQHTGLTDLSEVQGKQKGKCTNIGVKVRDNPEAAVCHRFLKGKQSVNRPLDRNGILFSIKKRIIIQPAVVVFY